MNLTSLLNALPGAVAQGLIWGIMAIGVYITYKVLDLADLTVDGSMATGGAVCVMLMLAGVNMWLALACAIVAGMLAGLMTGIFHTVMGIPPILAGILTQLSLYSINLAIMGFKANQGTCPTRSSLPSLCSYCSSRRYTGSLERSWAVLCALLARTRP